MAMLVAVAGGAVGASLAGTLGIAASTAVSFGFTAGGILGNLLFPPKDTSKGPRLDDLSVTSSTYGSARSLGYGTLRMAGNLIWVSGNQIQEIKARGGKGGGNKSESPYRYVATFAIAFGEGEAEDVLRIWADGKLIFDKRSANITNSKTGLNYRFYPGSTTQMPDSSYVADVGPEKASAFRGTVYLVFERLELADFGNRIPNITAEITYKKSPLSLVKVSTLLGFQDLDEYTTAWAGFDPLRGYGYLLDAIFPSGGPRNFKALTFTGLRKIQLHSTEMVEIDQRPSWLALNQRPYPPLEGPDNDYYQWINAGPVYVTKSGAIIAGIRGRFGTVKPIASFDPNSLVRIGQYGGLDGYFYGFTQNGSWTVNRLAEISLIGYTRRWDYLLLSDNWANLGLVQSPSLSYVWSENTGTLISPSYTYNVVGGFTGTMFGEGWAVQGPFIPSVGPAFRLKKIKVEGLTEIGYSPQTTQLLTKVTSEDYHTFVATEVFPGSPGWRSFASVLAYSVSDNTLIISAMPEPVSGPAYLYLFKWDVESKQVLWISEPLVGAPSLSRFVVISQTVEGNTLGFVISGNGWLVDLNSGRFLVKESYNVLTAANAQVGHYDPASETFYTTTTLALSNGQGEGIARFYFRKGDGLGVSLASIVQDICLRSGLRPHQFDVSDLSNTLVPGYMVGNQSTARSIIDNLRSVFLFDGVESDFQLKFRLRGKEPIRV